MPYQFIDAYGSVLTADSSIISGVIQREVLNIASVTGTVNVAFSGAPSISGTVNIAGTPSISGTVNIAGTPSISGTVNVSSVTSYPLVYRNDTLASILGADQTYRQTMGDSAGRLVIKPFVSEDATLISYTGSVTSASVTLIQASVIGKKSYITDFFVANTGATTVLVQFQDGGGAILGQTIAPTTGGSNGPGLAIPLKTAVSQDLVFKPSASTSILYLTVKGYQAP